LTGIAPGIPWEWQKIQAAKKVAKAAKEKAQSTTVEDLDASVTVPRIESAAMMEIRRY
jgi:hypothetical protein